MTNRVYVGGLSYATTTKQLEELFSQYGHRGLGEDYHRQIHRPVQRFRLRRDGFRRRSRERDSLFERDRIRWAEPHCERGASTGTAAGTQQ